MPGRKEVEAARTEAASGWKKGTKTLGAERSALSLLPESSALAREACARSIGSPLLSASSLLHFAFPRRVTALNPSHLSL